MIPKIIHYCWFGKGKKTELIEKCISTWQKWLPSYTLREWNEDNFDVALLPYAREAYEAGKYAFVSDYVRLYALYHYGGIYFDTDVEVIKSFDPLLSLHGFSGFETDVQLTSGVISAEAHNPFIKELMDQYASLHFLQADHSLDLTANVVRITTTALSEGLVLNNHRQVIKGITYFPSDYFCPKNPQTRLLHCTANTYAIHHFSASWQSVERQQEKIILDQLHNEPLNLQQKLSLEGKRKILHLKKHLRERGITGTLKLYMIDNWKKIKTPQ